MRIAWLRAGWALSLAGALGLTATVAAEPVQRGVRVLPASKPVEAVVAPLSKGSALLSEINVELAWLGDPVTFPYQLAAIVEGHTLVVGGMVPDQTVRAQAIKLAREHGGLPMIDKLTVSGKHSAAPPAFAPKELQKVTVAALARQFPKLGRDMQLSVEPNGAVNVFGSIPSFEDKLNVSRCISQLTGCTRVANHLNVTNVQREGKPCFQVTADGKLIVADSTFALAQTTKPATPPASVAATKPMMLPASVPTQTTKPATMPASVAATKPMMLPASVPTQTTKPATMPASVAAAKPMILPASVPTQPIPTAKTQERSPAPPTKTSPATAAMDASKTMQTQYTTPKSGTNPGVVQGTYRPAPAAPTPALAPPAQPRKVAPNPQLAADVCQKVKAIGGEQVRDVSVVDQGNGMMRIDFRVRTEPEAQPIFMKISQLPELNSYKVETKVTVAPW